MLHGVIKAGNLNARKIWRETLVKIEVADKIAPDAKTARTRQRRRAISNVLAFLFIWNADALCPARITVQSNKIPTENRESSRAATSTVLMESSR